MQLYSGIEIIDLYQKWVKDPPTYNKKVVEVLDKIAGSVIQKSRYSSPESHEDKDDVKLQLVEYLYKIWTTRITLSEQTLAHQNKRLFCFLRSKASYFLIDKIRARKQIHNHTFTGSIPIKLTKHTFELSNDFEDNLVKLLLKRRKKGELNLTEKLKLAKTLKVELNVVEQAIDNLIQRLSINEIFNNYSKEEGSKSLTRYD